MNIQWHCETLVCAPGQWKCAYRNVNVFVRDNQISFLFLMPKISNMTFSFLAEKRPLIQIYFVLSEVGN